MDEKGLHDIKCIRSSNGSWMVKLNGEFIAKFDGWFEVLNRANAIDLAARIGCAINAKIGIEN